MTFTEQQQILHKEFLDEYIGEKTSENFIEWCKYEMADVSKPDVAQIGGYTCKSGHTGKPYVGTDGFKRCRTCRTEYRRKWDKAHPENQAKVNERVKAWRVAHPERRQAQIDAQHNKDVIKGTYCEACLNETELEMHHPDYSKPLLVTTLCKSCHEGVHHAVEPNQADTHSVPKAEGLRVGVRTMIDSGYTYREIANKLNLSSTSQVAYYAKDVHQHRLVVVDVRPGRQRWACSRCHRHFALADDKGSDLLTKGSKPSIGHAEAQEYDPNTPTRPVEALDTLLKKQTNYKRNKAQKEAISMLITPKTEDRGDADDRKCFKCLAGEHHNAKEEE